MLILTVLKDSQKEKDVADKADRIPFDGTLTNGPYTRNTYNKNNIREQQFNPQLYVVVY